MARYLTPAKIGTLIIVESYLQNRENPKSDSKLLGLITQQLHPAINCQDGSDGPPEDASAFAASLASIPSNFPGRTHYDDFVHAAWTTADLDQLHHLFDRLYGILTPEDPEDRKVTPASPIGHFIRRCNVEWTRLRFADSLALLNAYKSYIESTWESWARTQPEAAQAYASKDSNVDSVPGAISGVLSTEAPMISSDDIDIALSTSIHSLQKLGARVPADLKAKLNSWLVTHQQASDTQNLHHFMDFFEAWRAGQYTLALEELHRYFDYSIASKGAAAGGQGDGVKVYYQYALLHLSVLHADFERWEEALGTMEECIATGKIESSTDMRAERSHEVWLTPIQQEKTKTQLVSTLLFHGYYIFVKRTTYLLSLLSDPSRLSLVTVVASKMSSLFSKQRPRTGSTGVLSAVPCWRRRSSSSDMCVACSQSYPSHIPPFYVS
jgi:anaphase-promoting complex subunit 5